MEVLAGETTFQQERLQAIAEKRKKQAEIENKRRQLEDDRRQLQHLKSKALRERWLLEGTPSSASEGDRDMRRQMQEDEQKARHLEESISRLEQEIEVLENADTRPAVAKENVAAPSPAKQTQKAEVVLNSQQVRRSQGPHPCWPQSETPPLLGPDSALAFTPHALASLAQWIWCRPVDRRVLGSILVKGKYVGCSSLAWPSSGHVQEATNRRVSLTWICLSVFPSLFHPLKINGKRSSGED
uniref:Paralemmin-1 n=1 Tax=Myotis myotis TaxID=51298 RepID=A0A7J7XIQ0_MYOMY|nr:paralemmin [Myotis myotis]